MYCSNCGSKNDDGVKFCKDCGRAVPGSAPNAGRLAPAQADVTPGAVRGSAQQLRRVESFYPPAQLQTASPGRRLGGYVLDTLVALVTFGIGWLTWFLIVAQRGQTPGKQMLGMYIMREDGSRAGGWYTLVREILVKALFLVVIAVISGATNGVGILLWLPAALWCTWDRERQCLWDKIPRTYIAHSPGGYRPPTAAQLRPRGEQPPAVSGRTALSPPAPPDPTDPPSGGVGREHATISSLGGEQPGVADRLRELQQLCDEGLITAEQYDERRASLIEEL